MSRPRHRGSSKRVVEDTTDGEQSLPPKVPHDATLDGDEKGTVPRPESDDGVADGGLGVAVCLGGRRWADGVTVPLSCFFCWRHLRIAFIHVLFHFP